MIYGSKHPRPRATPSDKDIYIAINHRKKCINYYISHCACAAFIATTAVENGKRWDSVHYSRIVKAVLFSSVKLCATPTLLLLQSSWPAIKNTNVQACEIAWHQYERGLACETIKCGSDGRYSAHRDVVTTELWCQRKPAHKW